MSDLIERAKAALEGATKGRRVQFAPRFCKEAEGAPFSEWDSSHETSVILPDGTRYRGYSRHKHSADAELDNMAPDLARALIDTTAERDALRAENSRLRALAEAAFGMADEGISAPSAAYRWCERIDEIFHYPAMIRDYAQWSKPLPEAALQEDTPND